MIPRCRDLSTRLSEARDSGLRLSALERLHLWYCLACRRLRVQLELIAKAAAAEPRTGAGLSDEAKQRMKRRLTG